MTEHRILRYSGKGGDDGNPLNPHNGNLERTLDAESADGWTLLSFDWNSWRTAVLNRPARVSDGVRDEASVTGWAPGHSPRSVFGDEH